VVDFDARARRLGMGDVATVHLKWADLGESGLEMVDLGTADEGRVAADLALRISRPDPSS